LSSIVSIGDPLSVAELGRRVLRVKRAPRALPAIALWLFVGGMLATSFHLATEEHFLAPGLGHGSTTWRGTQGSPHLPHSPSDHDADRTVDEPVSPSTETVLAPNTFAPPPADELKASLEIALRLTPCKVPIDDRVFPPGSDPPTSIKQPRAPPAA
jgi:hypothetical protein